MDEVAVDIDEAGAVRLLIDQMVGPDFVVEGTRIGHAENSSPFAIDAKAYGVDVYSDWPVL
jgi:hypothetical protein